MSISGDFINLGNPMNDRHDEEMPGDAKVTHADHPLRRPGPRREDAFFPPSSAHTHPPGRLSDPGDPSSPRKAPVSAAARPPLAEIPLPLAAMEAAAAMQPGSAVVPPVLATPPVFDCHAQTVRDPEIEMVGELTSHRDPFSGDTGIHPFAVSLGSLIGGAALGALAGWIGAVFGGSLVMALGASAGCILGGLVGGYTGKHLGERCCPATESCYWRHRFALRTYVPRGAKYADWETAYMYGIEMREKFLNATWEEAEPAIREGWEKQLHPAELTWERARPAIQDAWDHLTPEPGEGEVAEEERERDE